MKCDVCHDAEATVFLTQIVNGTMQKINLCPTCAKAKGVNDPAGFQLADLFVGLGEQKAIDTDGGTLKCPVCGFTATDLKKTGRLGCSNCYEVFEGALEPMLKSMHKGTSHKGKAPAAYAQKRRNYETLKELQEKLRAAVDKEEYEQAATIRDQIRLIESSMNS
jgi:protein arginine kinase activator